MRWLNRGRGTLFGALAGVASGAVGGVVAAALLASGANGRVHAAAATPLVAATHLPPLLTVPGQPVTLRYAIVCPPQDGDIASGEPCDGGGEVHIRAGRSGSFATLPLTRGTDSSDGRYFVHVPDEIASSPSGFSYYAVLRDEATGNTTTLPAGAASSPQDSFPLTDPVVVRLAPHVFGATRHATARVIDAPWGSGSGEAGLTGGGPLARIGPSSFDVSASGTVTLLDEVNRRVERWNHGSVTTTAVDVPPAIDDLAVGADGSIYVLDGRSDRGETPLLRTFAPDGRLRAADHLAERTWTQLTATATGAVVQEHPSEQWLNGTSNRGRAGRPQPDGSELIVLRSGTDEVRLARIVGGRARTSWRIVSSTPLGEVQLAQANGNHIVLVVKTYTQSQDEFEVLVLDGHGVVHEFSVPAAEWSEAAPLARFRVAGSSLYQLGSDANGAFVDRFDLGGPS